MRLFTAIELPDEVRALVAWAQAELRAAGVRARWAAPERAHLTVHFLGERPAEDARAIAARLAPACAGVAPVPIAVGAPGKFRSGVLWLGIDGDLGPLERACRQALGLPDERYRPHITLARDYKGPLPGLAMPETVPSFTVSELTIFRSELLPSGAVHSVLERLPLGQPS